MPTSSSDGRREALLAHVDSLYTLAQTVASDPAEAERLVELTYSRALATPPEEQTNPDDKVWLFQLLLEVGQEMIGPTTDEEQTPVLLASDDGEVRERSPLERYQRKLTEQFLERALPVAVATLPADDRTLLFLCDVENISCVDAAGVLNMDAQLACERLGEARRALEEAVRAQASAVEVRLLHAAPPRRPWMQTALRRTMQNVYAPTPPTLLPALSSGYRTDVTPKPKPATGDRRPPAASAARGAPFQKRMRRSLISLLIVLSAGLIGYLVSDALEQNVDANVISLSVSQADDVQLSLETDLPEEAENYVRQELAWRLTVPDIEGAALTGVALQEVAPQVRVPVFVYQDALTGEVVTLYTFTYALLDRNAGRLHLEPDILHQIEDEEHFDLHDLGENKVLVFRNRDDIFVAVTQHDAETLRERIYFPS